MKQSNGYRMRLWLVGFVISEFFFSTASVCSAWEYVWTQKADMPTPRWGHTSAVVNDKIYIIGGGPSENTGPHLASVEEYDPATDTWTKKADMPTARGWNSASSAVVDGKIYVIGGDGGEDVDEWCLPTVEEYEPATNTWTRKADMPTGRDCLATVAVDGKIYAVGGARPDANVGVKTVEMYDPSTDTWSRKADLPHGVWYVNANVVNGKIYVIGGRPNFQAWTWVQEYDPATDTWTLKADMPIATSQMGSVVLGDKIIVIGGWLWSLKYPYATVQMYDTETDTWTIEDDAPFLRASFSSEVVNNRIYAIGGTDRPHPCPALSTVYELGPVLDLNGDGIVDSADMCIMVEHWGTDYSLCDIAPPLFGDGTVDVEDLKIVAQHLFEEVDDPTLIAHWAFDETEGILAHASAAYYDGVLFGDPVWQPDGGMVAGALQLDGMDDFVMTNPVLNPADGKFSVIAWIQGGEPGQVIISQEGAANWFMIDTEGNLISELRSSRRSGNPILSQTNITDGNWHRIGFVWDGLNRILYVDGVAAAQDTQADLEGFEDGLYIGCGKNMESGTFWSGLIDDVRIYNRAVNP